MADVYPKAAEGFLTKQIDWLNDTIKAVLVDTGAYTYSTAHQFLSDIPSGARIATSAALANKTATLGVADADDITISAVTGATVEAVVVYQDTGTAGTSRLLAFLDNFTVNGAAPPFTPNGGGVSIAWANGTNKIFLI